MLLEGWLIESVNAGEKLDWDSRAKRRQWYVQVTCCHRTCLTKIREVAIEGAEFDSDRQSHSKSLGRPSYVEHDG